MKKIFTIVGSLIILIAILIVGYFIGNKIGQTTGAQQYTKKLFTENEISISTSGMLEQINTFRNANGKPAFVESIGVCQIAQKRAEINFKKSANMWDSASGSYKKEADTGLGITLDDAKKMCPECIFMNDKKLEDNYIGELSYVVLHPDVCSVVDSKANLACKGDESYGVTEHFPERILKQWMETDSSKETLLMENYGLGCVRSYGGSVILTIAVDK